MTEPRTLSVVTEQQTLIVMPLRSVGTLGEENIRPELDELLARFQLPYPRSAVIDMTKVSYFGTALLKAIHAVWQCVKRLDGRMALCNVSPTGREVLRVSKFDTLWPICDSRSEAIENVTGE